MFTGEGEVGVGNLDITNEGEDLRGEIGTGPLGAEPGAFERGLVDGGSGAFEQGLADGEADVGVVGGVKQGRTRGSFAAGQAARGGDGGAGS